MIAFKWLLDPLIQHTANTPKKQSFIGRQLRVVQDFLCSFSVRCLQRLTRCVSSSNTILPLRNLEKKNYWIPFKMGLQEHRFSESGSYPFCDPRSGADTAASIPTSSLSPLVGPPPPPPLSGFHNFQPPLSAQSGSCLHSVLWRITHLLLSVLTRPTGMIRSLFIQIVGRFCVFCQKLILLRDWLTWLRRLKPYSLTIWGTCMRPFRLTRHRGSYRPLHHLPSSWIMTHRSRALFCPRKVHQKRQKAKKPRPLRPMRGYEKEVCFILSYFLKYSREQTERRERVKT